MSNEAQQQQIIDYIDGRLKEAERKSIESQLAENAELRTWFEQMKEISVRMKTSAEWKPSNALRESFNAALQQELEEQKKGKHVFFAPAMYRIAASLLLILLFGSIAFWYTNEQQKNEEILALRNEMESTRALVFSLLQNDLSASQRMMGVKAAYQTTHRDDAIVQALIKVMNEDANINVRLSAVEALGKFSKEAMVRTALLESLTKQTEPAVQIALIQVLVQMKEQEAVKSLEKIIEDESVLESVRDEAHAGIIKLS
jgi:hypothetical protein